MNNQGKSSFTVLGAGRSGVAVSRLLAGKGNSVILCDESPAEKLKYLDAEGLKAAGVELRLGEKAEDIPRCDMLVKSPGIPPSNAMIVKAREEGIPVISEIEAAFRYCPCRIVAITGTNGKTTTTVLAGEIFRNGGIDTKVCGNVGVAFSDVVPELKSDSVVVLEVSSYQLNDIVSFKPDAGVIMNITPDHLDWHGNFDNYLRAKLRIAENMDGSSLLIVNHDDEILKRATEKAGVPKAYFGLSERVAEYGESGAYVTGGVVMYFNKKENLIEEIMETRDISIRGNHNLYNSLAAAISARSLGIKAQVIKETLASFPGVEHRIEFVREFNGVKFFNDSKATNVESMTVALQSFRGNLILIMGGREKGNDYTAVDDLVKQKVKAIIAVGESKEKIISHFGKMLKAEPADDFEDAVHKAVKESSAGDSVLLSPACKSFDMFDSFEHRGEVFKRIVNELK